MFVDYDGGVFYCPGWLDVISVVMSCAVSVVRNPPIIYCRGIDYCLSVSWLISDCFFKPITVITELAFMFDWNM